MKTAQIPADCTFKPVSTAKNSQAPAVLPDDLRQVLTDSFEASDVELMSDMLYALICQYARYDVHEEEPGRSKGEYKLTAHAMEEIFTATRLVIAVAKIGEMSRKYC